MTHEKPVISVGISTRKEQGPIELNLDNQNPDIWKRFHCPVCGFIAFEYKDSLTIVTAGVTTPDVKSPARVQCKSCKTLFVIQN